MRLSMLEGDIPTDAKRSTLVADSIVILVLYHQLSSS